MDVAVEQVLPDSQVEGSEGRVGVVARVQDAEAGSLDEVIRRAIQVGGDRVGVFDWGWARAAGEGGSGLEGYDEEGRQAKELHFKQVQQEGWLRELGSCWDLELMKRSLWVLCRNMSNRLLLL